MKSRIACAIACLLALISNASAQTRTLLTAPTTFYVATTGSDSSGCGLTAAAPCTTLNYLYNNQLLGSYDAGGQQVTLSAAQGTYTAPFTMLAPMVGQSGPIIITGDCSSAAAAHATLFQPTSRTVYGGAFVFYGSGVRAQIQCMMIDHTTLLIPVWSPNYLLDGADMLTADYGAQVLIGNPALKGQFADVTLGCNIAPWNQFSGFFLATHIVQNDINVDTSLCNVGTGASVASNSATFSVGSIQGVVQNMGIVGPNFPIDAFVASVSAPNTVQMACWRTSPCLPNTTGSVPITFFGGGANLINGGNGAHGFWDTGIGDPSATIFVNFLNYYESTQAPVYLDDDSSENAGYITFTNPQYVRGNCMILGGNSVFQAYQIGMPYVPCNGGQPPYSGTTNAVATGSSTITFTSGNFPTSNVATLFISDVYQAAATFSAGSMSMSVSATNGIYPGDPITGPGVLTGARVASVSGNTITVNPCGLGPRCVNGSPLYQNQSGAVLTFRNSCLVPGARVTSESPATFNITPPTVAPCVAGTQMQIWGTVQSDQDNSMYH